MSDPTYCWDATLLIHAERADRLDVLGSLLPPVRHVVCDVVRNELGQMGIPGWIEQVTLGLAELQAFSRWLGIVGTTDGRNRGEAAVLAWAEVHGAIPIIDDGDARRAARRRKVDVHGSLWALTEGIKGGRAPAPTVSGFCDTVMHHGVRWPFKGGGFVDWASANDLLDSQIPGQGKLL